MTSFSALEFRRPFRALQQGPVGAASVLVLVALVTGACAVSRNPLSGRSRAYATSWQEEIRIGREADPQIVAEYGLYADRAVADYVDSLGQAIVAVSHLRRPGAEAEFQATSFHFRVLDSPVVNAFALPGGYVYVTRGILAHLENEAQLAVVLGHEIGHVAGRHGSKRATTQLLGTALLVGGAVGGSVLFGDEFGSTILELGSAAAGLLFLRYGRDDERESDALGVEYASLAGYDASQGSAFFRTLARIGERSGQSLPSFLSTHPDPGEREATIARLSGEWSAGGGNRVDRARYLAAVDGMVVGENPRNGFVRSGVFHHPDLALEFPIPEGFEVVNQASRVLLVGPGQRAVITFALDSSPTAREAVEAFGRREGVTVVQSGVGSSNGLPGRFSVAEAAAEDGTVYRLRVHFTEYGGRVYAFTAVTTAPEYAAYEDRFIRTARGLAPLRDPALLAMEPGRIRISRVDRPATLRALVPTMNAAGMDAESMAILNQVGLDDRLEAGRSVKLVR